MIEYVIVYKAHKKIGNIDRALKVIARQNLNDVLSEFVEVIAALRL